jgi:bifunctional ADP-heptose synthase (sugar kinase/adenylyltransferase)
MSDANRAPIMPLARPDPGRLGAARMLVVGDAMLDRYWFGGVDRISPEAPVPVVQVQRTEERLGGAANVALNVQGFGARPTLMMAERAQAFRRELRLDALLLTRAEEGMTLFDEHGALHVAAEARQVFDVTGAGDTVIATLAAMAAAGLSLREAVAIANRAAGIVVSRFGTAHARFEEVFP